jgi:predicted deacylase
LKLTFAPQKGPGKFATGKRNSTVKIGTIEALPGKKAFGYFKTGETHGRFDVHIPLHIITGAKKGPLLVVQSGTSGLEIEPALILPKIVADLDPDAMAGTLVVVPLMNTSGFLFEQINSAWDDKNLNALGRGDATGSVSEQMIYAYYREVLAQADALIDIHTGAQWSYDRYAGVYEGEGMKKSRALAISLGLPQVLMGQPADGSMAQEVAKDGKAVVSTHIGGGPGLRDFREDDMARIRRAVYNALRHLGMLSGDIEFESATVAVIDEPAVLKPVGERGFTFMDTAKRGLSVKAGEQIGYVRHPFTGDVVEEITAPKEGVVLFAGASWPVPLEDTTLAIIGNLSEQIQVG